MLMMVVMVMRMGVVRTAGGCGRGGVLGMLLGMLVQHGRHGDAVKQRGDGGNVNGWD